MFILKPYPFETGTKFWVADVVWYDDEIWLCKETHIADEWYPEKFEKIGGK